MKNLFRSQPKLLIFIELKIVEIIGVCMIASIGYGGYLFLTYLNSFKIHDIPIMAWVWLIIMAVGILVFLYLIGYLIYYTIKANWNWADRIARKK